MGVGQTFGNKRKLEVKIKSEVPKQKNFRAMISELQKRSRELFLSITGRLNDLKQFLKKLIIDWGKFSLEDKYRKNRLSSLNTLKLLKIMA
ncbi:MAG: hypothetical protein O7C58_07135 [Rickettsia endosymbiont of Ixodes persulcatus]|nr:hypothetical protein [Rickettsia endosymbiont of Ixodes persulcatus]